MSQAPSWDALWEVPLGLLSFCFARGVKATLTLLSRYYNPADRKAKPEWQVVSAEFLASPIKLLWTMSRARWNLHALIAIAGPFTVKSHLQIDTAALFHSAPSWTAVVYTLQGFKTLTSISSLTTAPTKSATEIPLPPGRYLVGLRHYHWSDPITLPAITVDGQLVLAAAPRPAPPNANQFYRDLIQRRRWIHRWLNYYVYPLLRYRRYLPARLVHDIFLPVPNPETHFYFGALAPGETLTIKLVPALLHDYAVYLSHYSRDCFPLDWQALTAPEHHMAARPDKTLYILRVHPNHPTAAPIQAHWIDLILKP